MAAPVLSIGIHGATGRMGTRLIQLIADDPTLRLGAALDRADHPRLGDDAGTTTFRLVPRKHGRVVHLDVKVDDNSATIKSMTWTYEDGGYVTFDQNLETQKGNYLVKSQTGHVELPSYKADVTIAYTNYKLNVAIGDEVFTPDNK